MWIYSLILAFYAAEQRGIDPQRLKAQLEFQLDEGEPVNQNELEILFNTSYVFAETYTLVSKKPIGLLLWDLSTYREDDDSYDIVFAPIQKLKYTQFVCRDFLEFIYDFCLSTRLQDLRKFKKSYYPKKINIPPTFNRFSMPYLIARGPEP